MEISVALRKESVDRNACIAGRRVGPGLSLSARRAWIEIQGGDWVAVRVEVALRKESVDRNLRPGHRAHNASRSLSARRAWIEIILNDIFGNLLNSRSPQGERG